MWYALRSGSGGGAGGSGDVGVVGRLLCRIGGGGTSCIAGVPSGGDIRLVTTAICGSCAPPLKDDDDVEVADALRGIGIVAIIDDEVRPGRSSDIVGSPVRLGRRPGCEAARLRP